MPFTATGPPTVGKNVLIPLSFAMAMNVKYVVQHLVSDKTDDRHWSAEQRDHVAVPARIRNTFE